MHRALTHACTTLDVCWRKWRALQAPGKAALTSHVNARLLNVHADTVSSWPKGFAAVRAGVARRAQHEQQTAEEAMAPVMRDLEKVVADMRAAADALRSKVEVLAQQRQPAASFTSPSLAHGSGSAASTMDAQTARQLVERVETTVQFFEKELQLRRTVVRELMGEVGGVDTLYGSELTGPRPPPGWDASARLLLSAWVLEPHLEHEQLELFFEGLAAEPVPSPGMRRSSPRTGT